MSVDAGTVYSSIRIRLEQLDQDLKGVYARLDSLESQITQKMDKPTKAVTASFNAMSLAGVAAFLGIGRAIKTTIGTYATFEQSMANVSSVAGASTAEFNQLTNAAEHAGETTRFTASQAADALYYMASAGYNATDSVNALDGVLSLAQATGSDLATTSASMAATISQFGLKASDAAKVANVFAAAITSSQANMEKLTTGLRQVGPVSGTLGISLEEVTANLDALFNKGFQGEQAGTALRSILLDLVDPSSAVVAALKAQGLEYDKVNPRVVGLSGAFNNMAAAGVDLTTVFNKVSASEALALIDTAKKATGDLTDLQKAITGTNKAAEAMATQNNTMAGDLDITKSKAQATGNAFAKDFTPALRVGIRALGDIVASLGKLPTPIRVIIGTVATLTAGFGGITAALALFGVTITATAPVIAGIALAITGLVTATTLVAKHFNDQKNITEQLDKVTGELQATSGDYSKLQDELATKAGTLTAAEKEVYENRKKLLALKIQDQLAELAKQYDKTTSSIKKQSDSLDKTNTSISNIDSAVEKYRKNLEESGWTQEEVNHQVEIYRQQKLGALVDKQRTQVENLTKAQTDQKDSINAIAKAVADGTIDISTYRVTNRALYDVIMAQVGAIKEQSTGIKETGEAAAAATPEIFDWKAAIKSALGLDPKTFNTGAQAVTQYTANLRSSLENAITVAKKNGKNVSDVYKDYADDVDKAIKSLLESGEYKENEATIQSLEKLRDEFRGNFDTASYDEVIDKQNKLITATKEGSDAVEKFNVQMEHPTWSTEQIDEYINKLHELKSAQSETIDWNKELKTSVTDLAESMGSTIESGFSSLITAIKAAADGEKEWSKVATTAWAAFGSSALNAIATVIEALGSKMLISAINSAADAAAQLSTFQFVQAGLSSMAANKYTYGALAAYTAAGVVKGLAGSFSTGGIVGGSSYTGDNLIARVNSGEVVSTADQYSAMTEMISKYMSGQTASGNSGNIVVKFSLNGKELKTFTKEISRIQKNGDY